MRLSNIVKTFKDNQGLYGIDLIDYNRSSTIHTYKEIIIFLNFGSVYKRLNKKVWRYIQPKNLSPMRDSLSCVFDWREL